MEIIVAQPNQAQRYEDMNYSKFKAEFIGLLKTHQTIEMNITPIMAQVMMEFNFKNRSITAKRVRAMADDMKNDNWYLTGQPIIFSEPDQDHPRGALNTGQHRLRACILANVSFKTDVRFGIKRSAFAYTDTGKSYRGSDVLTVLGELNSTNLSAALGWVYRYQLGLPEASSITVPNERVIALLNDNPQIRLSLRVASNLRKDFPGFQPSIMTACHYLFSRQNPAEADEFFELTGTGIGLKSKHDPIYRLRNRMKERDAKRVKYSPLQQMALVIKAWNFWRNREQKQTLIWRIDEQFPIIFGMPHPVKTPLGEEDESTLDSELTCDLK